MTRARALGVKIPVQSFRRRQQMIARAVLCYDAVGVIIEYSDHFPRMDAEMLLKFRLMRRALEQFLTQKRSSPEFGEHWISLWAKEENRLLRIVQQLTQPPN